MVTIKKDHHKTDWTNITNQTKFFYHADTQHALRQIHMLILHCVWMMQ